jgi:hypothetical protein
MQTILTWFRLDGVVRSSLFMVVMVVDGNMSSIYWVVDLS